MGYLHNKAAVLFIVSVISWPVINGLATPSMVGHTADLTVSSHHDFTVMLSCVTSHDDRTLFFDMITWLFIWNPSSRAEP